MIYNIAIVLTVCPDPKLGRQGELSGCHNMAFNHGAHERGNGILEFGELKELSRKSPKKMRIYSYHEDGPRPGH
jgi:hypothetical protein